MGIVVYLMISYEEPAWRLGEPTDGAAALKNGMTLRDLHGERASCYERYADLIIEKTGKDTGEVIDGLRAYFEGR